MDGLSAKLLAHEDALVAGLGPASRLRNRLARRGADSPPSFDACRAEFRDTRAAKPPPPRTRAAGDLIPGAGGPGDRDIIQKQIIGRGQQHDDANYHRAFLKDPHRALRDPRHVVIEHRPRRLAYAGDVVPIGPVHDFHNGRSVGSGRSPDARFLHHQSLPPEWYEAVSRKRSLWSVRQKAMESESIRFIPGHRRADLDEVA